MLKRIRDGLLRMKIWSDTHGQDMVEYALLAGFVAVVVGAAFPPVHENISTIFSKLESSAEGAAN